MKEYYLPRGEKERSAWLKNFALKFAGVATTLGFTAAEATAVTNDSKAFAYMLDLLDVFKAETRERTDYKDILSDGPLGSALGAIRQGRVVDRAAHRSACHTQRIALYIR